MTCQIQLGSLAFIDVVTRFLICFGDSDTQWTQNRKSSKIRFLIQLPVIFLQYYVVKIPLKVYFPDHFSSLFLQVVSYIRQSFW